MRSGVEHLGGGDEVEDGGAQLVAADLAEVDEHHRGVLPGASGELAELLAGHAVPLRAHPDRDRRHDLGLGLAGLERDRPLLLDLPLRHPGRQVGQHGLPQHPVTLGRLGRRVRREGSAPASVVLVPLPTLGGLEPVLRAVLLDHTLVCEGSEQLRHPCPQTVPVVLDVLDEEVGEVLGGRAHPGVRGPLGGEQRDEVDQPQDAGAQGAVVRVGGLVGDQLLGLLEQAPGLVEVGVLLVVEEVRAHDRAHRTPGGPPVRLVHHAQLRAQLTRPAAGVGDPEHLLPEPPSGGQQRVVGEQHPVVRGAVRDPGPCELAADLALGPLDHGRQLGCARGLLLQQHAADHLVDVLVLQVGLHAEPVLELLEHRGRGEVLLTRRDQQDAPLELRRHGLDDVLHGHRAVRVVVDVLLDLVENHERRRHDAPTDAGEHPTQQLDRVGDAHRGLVRELGLELLEEVRRGGRERGPLVEDRLRERHREVEPGNRPVDVAPLGLERGDDRVLDALVPQPQPQVGGSDLVREPRRAQHDREEREVQLLDVGRVQRACRGPGRGADPPGRGAELSQAVRDRTAHGGQPPRRGRVGQRRVPPQVLQDPDQVRLAAAVEAADPHGRLRGAGQMAQIGVEDPLEPALVLALADEAGELVPQDGPLPLRAQRRDLGHAVIGDDVVERVLDEQLAVEGHGRSFVAVMATAR